MVGFGFGILSKNRDEEGIMSIQKPPAKLYYSLRQASEMVGVQPTTIKSWEKDYTQLQPSRNRAGNRYYTDKDLNLLFLIKELLIEQKLSVEEIQHRLRRRRSENQANESIYLKRLLAEIKLEIREIKSLLEV